MANIRQSKPERIPGSRITSAAGHAKSNDHAQKSVEALSSCQHQVLQEIQFHRTVQ